MAAGGGQVSGAEREPGGETRSIGWGEAVAAYLHPRVIGMLFLGFSAGLPLLLVFSTLTLWLNDARIDKGTIGLAALIGTTYSVKVFWSPIVDRVPLPLLHGLLGRRRSWMLLAQITIATGLIGMALNDPTAVWGQLGLEIGASDETPFAVYEAAYVVALFGLIVAFGSATQDIALDAYRIEAVKVSLQGAMAATYQFGYRLGMLVAGAGALFIADASGWTVTYIAMAACAGVGMVTVLLTPEPAVNRVRQRDPAVTRAVWHMRRRAPEMPDALVRAAGWLLGAVVRPVLDFFDRNGLHLALLILAFIGVYRISDLVMGVMANPFYSDIGFSKTEIATVSKLYGIWMTILGAFIGGVAVARFGPMRPLLAGAVMVATTNLLFALLAHLGADLDMLVVTISADNLSGGFAGSAFIAYLSSLTNRSYTATQYALFSSFMTLPGKLVSASSGFVVEAVGFVTFFLYAAAAGIPAILLVLVLMRVRPHAAADDESPASAIDPSDGDPHVPARPAVR